MEKLSMLRLFYDPTITHVTVGNIPHHVLHPPTRAQTLCDLCAQCTALATATLHIQHMTLQSLRVLLAALSRCISLHCIVIRAARPVSMAEAGAIAAGLGAFCFPLARMTGGRPSQGYVRNPSSCYPRCCIRAESNVLHANVVSKCRDRVVEKTKGCAMTPPCLSARGSRGVESFPALQRGCHNRSSHRMPIRNRSGLSCAGGYSCNRGKQECNTHDIPTGIHLVLDVVKMGSAVWAVITDAVRRSNRVVGCELRLPSSRTLGASLTRALHCCSGRLPGMARHDPDRLRTHRVEPVRSSAARTPNKQHEHVQKLSSRKPIDGHLASTDLADLLHKRGATVPQTTSQRAAHTAAAASAANLHRRNMDRNCHCPPTTAIPFSARTTTTRARRATRRATNTIGTCKYDATRAAAMTRCIPVHALPHRGASSFLACSLGLPQYADLYAAATTARAIKTHPASSRLADARPTALSSSPRQARRKMSARACPVNNGTTQVQNMYNTAKHNDRFIRSDTAADTLLPAVYPIHPAHARVPAAQRYSPARWASARHGRCHPCMTHHDGQRSCKPDTWTALSTAKNGISSNSSSGRSMATCATPTITVAANSTASTRQHEGRRGRNKTDNKADSRATLLAQDYASVRLHSPRYVRSGAQCGQRGQTPRTAWRPGNRYGMLRMSATRKPAEHGLGQRPCCAVIPHRCFAYSSCASSSTSATSLTALSRRSLAAAEAEREDSPLPSNPCLAASRVIRPTHTSLSDESRIFGNAGTSNESTRTCKRNDCSIHKDAHVVSCVGDVRAYRAAVARLDEHLGNTCFGRNGASTNRTTASESHRQGRCSALRVECQRDGTPVRHPATSCVRQSISRFGKVTTLAATTAPLRDGSASHPPSQQKHDVRHDGLAASRMGDDREEASRISASLSTSGRPTKMAAMSHRDTTHSKSATSSATEKGTSFVAPRTTEAKKCHSQGSERVVQPRVEPNCNIGHAVTQAAEAQNASTSSLHADELCGRKISHAPCTPARMELATPNLLPVVSAPARKERASEAETHVHVPASADSLKFIQCRVNDISKAVVLHQVKTSAEAEHHSRCLEYWNSDLSTRVVGQLSDIMMVLADLGVSSGNAT